MGQTCCSFMNVQRRGPAGYTFLSNQDLPLGYNKKKNMAVARYSYAGIGPNELTFDRGDTLELVNRDDEDWWLAKYPGHSLVGYVPAAYMCLNPPLPVNMRPSISPFISPSFTTSLNASLMANEWYHGPLTRAEAEQILLHPNNKVGAFLMRRSHRINAFVLSCRSFTYGVHDNIQYTCVKHFKIDDAADGHYIFGGRTHTSLIDVVDFFVTMRVEALPHPKQPCVKVTYKPSKMHDIFKNQCLMPQEESHYVKKISDGSFGEVWINKGL